MREPDFTFIKNNIYKVNHFPIGDIDISKLIDGVIIVSNKLCNMFSTSLTVVPIVLKSNIKKIYDIEPYCEKNEIIKDLLSIHSVHVKIQLNSQTEYIALCDLTALASTLSLGDRIGECPEYACKQLEIALSIQFGLLSNKKIGLINRFLSLIKKINIEKENSDYNTKQKLNMILIQVYNKYSSYCAYLNLPYEVLIRGNNEDEFMDNLIKEIMELDSIVQKSSS
ncbi:hypothetical protein AGE29_01700 [Clostridium botulinum]|uniref:Uncharacterized protein n=1 Tax=Clostridium botulinum (strain 657 / Type Ba4) TaxID=515621 RepID=A0A3F3A7F0_CLOB6|nr:hypothetical protein [Clostridium botulinum]ACQ54478.1 hypothetical protein CLJ_B2505 [Clostridium botulinum Ba4 str. 657]AXG90555.1 hypothetical protein AGE29_01700 [Clostridium botulinum]